MNLHKTLKVLQKGVSYFSAATGVLAVIFALLALFTGGISVIITIPIAIGVGLLWGAYGAKNALRSIELEEREEEERKKAIEDIRTMKEKLTHINKKIDDLNQPASEINTTTKILQFINKVPANDEKYCEINETKIHQMISHFNRRSVDEVTNEHVCINENKCARNADRRLRSA